MKESARRKKDCCHPELIGFDDSKLRYGGSGGTRKRKPHQWRAALEQCFSKNVGSCLRALINAVSVHVAYHFSVYIYLHTRTHSPLRRVLKYSIRYRRVEKVSAWCSLYYKRCFFASTILCTLHPRLVSNFRVLAVPFSVNKNYFILGPFSRTSLERKGVRKFSGHFILRPSVSYTAFANTLQFMYLNRLNERNDFSLFLSKIRWQRNARAEKIVISRARSWKICGSRQRGGK